MKSVLKQGFACVLGVACLGSSVRAADTVHARIEIEAGKVIAPVNQLVFGHNLEAADTAGIFGKTTVKDKILNGDGFWDPKLDGFSPAMLEKARALRPTVLRYPGGCLVHNFDWRKAVGPRETRGDWQFGIEEYLALCRELGAEPLMQISDYVLPAEEMPAHVAALVEYLNAPATPDHPWAMKRAEWGHPEPHGVKWFELGNESDHGNHSTEPQRIFSPQGYAAYANTVMAAMRAVDPTVKVGVHAETSVGRKNFDNTWNRIVFTEAGRNADFIAAHYYSSGGKYIADNPTATVRGALGASEIISHGLTGMRAFIKEATGRDVPLAITEYNNSFGGDKPMPYRFTFGGAIVAADALREFVDPRNDVIMANHWQMFYGYFGSVRVDMRTPGDFKTKELGAYYLYELWAKHFGTQFVASRVDTPMISNDGADKSLVFTGDRYKAGQSLATVSLARKLSNENITQEKLSGEVADDGTLRIIMDGFSGNAYPVLASAKNPEGVPAGTDYVVSYEARFIPKDRTAKKGSIGFGLCDSRGWAATERAVTIPGVESEEWTPFTDSIYGLPDTTGMDFVARIEPRGESVSGVLEVRNVKMEIRSKPTYPAYSMLTASSSLSADGNTLYVIVFNKGAEAAVATDIHMKGFTASRGARWEVAAPSFLSIDGIKQTASGAEVPLQTASMATVVLPPRSMTAFEFTK